MFIMDVNQDVDAEKKDILTMQENQMILIEK